MGRENLILLAAAEARGAVEDARARGEDLAGRFRAAARVTSGHWLVTDEDERFKAAWAAVFDETADEAERERLSAEIRGLRDLSAIMSGVPVDLERVEFPDGPIGLAGIWREVVS